MKVLVMGHQHSTTCQIVVAQPLRVLEAKGICQVQIRHPEQVQRQELASYDLILFVRTVDPEAYRRLEWAKACRKRTVYVIDDQFLAILQHSKIGRFYHKKKHRDTFIRFLKEVDVVKAESLRLSEWVFAHYNRNVVYFPGSIDFDLLDGIHPPKRQAGVIVIGYEGAKKEKSFAPVVPALHRIAAVYGKQVRFEFFGYLPQSLKKMDDLVYTSHEEDYRRFMVQLYQAGWDIGLAPMELSPFHTYKTNVKFRDYAACRIAGVYSASPVYDEVMDRETGLIVEPTEDAWFRAIAELIESPNLRKTITDHAHDVARKHYHLKDCAEHWYRQIIHV